MAGFFKKLVSGLTKTRDNIVHGIDNVFSGFSKIDDDFYEELEETLIMGDLGVNTTEEIIENLKEKVKENHIKDPADCKELLINTIKEQMDLGENAYEFENRKSIVLVIGVNGVGKTTSIGKLAAQLKAQGKKVVLAAADTFRAAVIICDTAGRLHNKKNLMEELKKINRIIDKEMPEAYRENLIVLDGTTGQNALSQLKEFKEAADVTGIILTKMDGTAKGGIAVAIQAEYGIPVKYIGVGEHIDDLQKFNSQDFVNALFDIPEQI